MQQSFAWWKAAAKEFILSIVNYIKVIEFLDDSIHHRPSIIIDIFTFRLPNTTYSE